MAGYLGKEDVIIIAVGAYCCAPVEESGEASCWLAGWRAGLLAGSLTS